MYQVAGMGERLPVVSIGWLAIGTVRTSRLAIAKIIINYWTQRLQRQGIVKIDYTLFFIGLAGLGLNKILWTITRAEALEILKENWRSGNNQH